MASFTEAVETTLKHEGGMTSDSGGVTKYGISKNAYPDLDIPNLTLDAAKQIYYRDYWKPLNLDALDYQPLANQIFDIGVNSGIRGVKRLLRDTFISLNLPLMRADLAPQDIAWLNAKDGPRINNQLAKMRTDFYTTLAKQSKYKKYLRGWLNRALSFVTSDTGQNIAQAGLAAGFFFIALFIYLNRKG